MVRNDYDKDLHVGPKEIICQEQNQHRIKDLRVVKLKDEV